MGVTTDFVTSPKKLSAQNFPPDDGHSSARASADRRLAGDDCSDDVIVGGMKFTMDIGQDEHHQMSVQKDGVSGQG